LSQDPNAPAVPIRATVFCGHSATVPFAAPELIPAGKFPSVTATLISGPSEVVLIDALHLKEEVQELGDLIERTGKKLTTIYLTHDHADHYLGAGPLMERFPDARFVALPHVIESMKETAESQGAEWYVLFGDQVVPKGPLPEPLEGDTLYVDGSEIKIIPVKQADVHPSTIVHIPEIDVVVAGDSIYNEVYPMLALSTRAEWEDWLNTIDVVESLNPKMIVAGHRRPDGDDYAVETMISQTRAYIQDFIAAYEVAASVEELVGTMMAKYPNHGGVWNLMFSAGNSISVRDGGPTATEAVMAALSGDQG
jgi:glyoxylase-like metal-dependent hydrolase (beta-lactamase superfamily II)